MYLRFVVVSVTAFSLTVCAYGQSLLENPSVFATVASLNTVPDHGNTAVSFLDYRDGGYSIVVVDASSRAENEIERVFYAEPVVSTYGQRAAWIGYTPLGEANVYVHDRSLGATETITSDAHFQNHPDLSGELLVWQDYRNAGSDAVNADIYLYDFLEKTSLQVTTDPGYQDLPRVSGTRIVWQDFRHADTSLATADIYVYDFTTKHEERLTEGAYYRTHPETSHDHVVWEDYRDGENGEIYLYDLSTSEETRITTNPAHQGFPTVYGDWILWLDYRNSSEQGDIYGYHLQTQKEYALLVHQAHQDAPHIYEKHVVWQDYRNDRFDLFEGTLLEPSSTSIDEPGRDAGSSLTAAPNPFSHDVTILLEYAYPYKTTLSIYDVLGRRIASRQVPGGAQRVAWDGRNDAGLPAPSGVYVAIIEDAQSAEKVLIVRRATN